MAALDVYMNGYRVVVPCTLYSEAEGFIPEMPNWLWG